MDKIWDKWLWSEKEKKHIIKDITRIMETKLGDMTIEDCNM